MLQKPNHWGILIDNEKHTAEAIYVSHIMYASIEVLVCERNSEGEIGEHAMSKRYFVLILRLFIANIQCLNSYPKPVCSVFYVKIYCIIRIYSAEKT